MQEVTLFMSCADRQRYRFRGRDKARRFQQSRERQICRGRCEWLGAVLLCNTMASEGYFSEGGTREDKSGAYATGHVGEIMSQYLHAYIGRTVVQSVDKVGKGILDSMGSRGRWCGLWCVLCCLVSHP